MFNSKTGNNNQVSNDKKRFYQKRSVKIITGILLFLLVIGGVVYWKADKLLSKISTGSLISSIAHSVPGVKDMLKGESEGRINVVISFSKTRINRKKE